MQYLEPLIKAIADRGDILLVSIVLFVMIQFIVVVALLRLLTTTNRQAYSALISAAAVEAQMRSAVEANTRATEANTSAISSLDTTLQVHTQHIKTLVELITPLITRRPR